MEIESAVKRTVSPDMQQQLLNIPGWRGFNNPWMAEDDQDVEFSYINLVDNPERYTGYKVHHNVIFLLWYSSSKVHEYIRSCFLLVSAATVHLSTGRWIPDGAAYLPHARIQVQVCKCSPLVISVA